jgi:hypothetical protein
MKAHRQGRTQRRFGRRAQLRNQARSRSLALDMIDRLVRRLLAHPRILQAIGGMLGLVMVALALRPLILTQAVSLRSIVATTTAPPARGSPPALDTPAQQAVIAVVTAYNQASIAAAVLNRPDALAPYLAPAGSAWADVQAEYQRRKGMGEAHEPTLTRWGVLGVAIDRDSATIETQELWDDRTTIDGLLISSQRGMLTRNTYALRAAPDTGRWLITTITTTTVIE